MIKKKTPPALDLYFEKAQRWKDEINELRNIVLSCGLKEEKKWGKPCYTFQEKNIVIIHSFKDYCGLLFFKGVLMKDPHKILIMTGPNTRVGRKVTFTDMQSLIKIRTQLKDCVKEAIAIEKAGLVVPKDGRKELVLVPELQMKLDKLPALEKAFAALTPGRKRGYNIFFSEAKQSVTRDKRIERCLPQIMKGKGLNDR